MPWCEDCAKYWSPSAMNADGTCPTCGRPVEPGRRDPVSGKTLDLKALATSTRPDDDDESAPWHFKLLMVALVGYLLWRFVDIFV